jgi:hypothetical protein
MFCNEIENKYFYLSEKIQQIFPHLEHVSIFYQDEKEFKYLEDGVLVEITPFLSSKLSTLRIQNLNYQWLLPSEIIEFYNFDNSRLIQLDLLSEHDNRMLILNFKSDIDGLNDIICLTFPKEIAFLGLYKAIKNLTTDDKILIGELLHKLFEIEFQSFKNNFKQQNRIAEYFKLKNQSISKTSPEIYHNYIQSELNSGINFLLKTRINFDFDNELIDYVVTKNYSINNICIFLKESYQTIKMVEQINGNFKFQLFHFKMIENEKSNSHTKTHIITSNRDKIIELLDKLEEAAKNIEKKGMLINGKLVAQFLTPPISPPAITDILKKNILKIENKLRLFPNNWLLIRKHLKPLRELEFKNQIITYNQKIS